MIRLPTPGTAEDNFGLNQHWGYDLPRTDIGMASAGCLVGQTRAGHREFMALIKQDKRYQSNKNYLGLAEKVIFKPYQESINNACN